MSYHFGIARLELCAGQDVSVSRAKAYAAMLNQLGHLIHYPRDPLLKDTMILKADWLSKAISFVLEDPEIKMQRGLVRHSRLTEIWDDPAREERYPRALHPIFLRLMETFDLSYQVVQPLETEPSSLVAELVPGARPENYLEVWTPEPDASDVERTQICRVVDAQNGAPARAEGLLYRLIVRLHRYSLGRENFEHSCHWQKGLVLDDAYTEVAI
jgi:internalin A